MNIRSGISWPTQCAACIHLQATASGRSVCAAFPSGIPDSLWVEARLHDLPHKGDRGIQFEENPDVWDVTRMGRFYDLPYYRQVIAARNSASE